MIAPIAVMPHILFTPREGIDDGVSDIACRCRACCDRRLGGIVMSADIIRFIPRPNRSREPTDFPAIAFRSVVEPDNLIMEQTDTAPCEHTPPESDFSA